MGTPTHLLATLCNIQRNKSTFFLHKVELARYCCRRCRPHLLHRIQRPPGRPLDPGVLFG